MRAASFLRLILDLVGIRQSEMIQTATDVHRTVRVQLGAACARVETDLTNGNQEQRGSEARKKKDESRSQKACQSL